jgi:hypothetical protein
MNVQFFCRHRVLHSNLEITVYCRKQGRYRQPGQDWTARPTPHLTRSLHSGKATTLPLSKSSKLQHTYDIKQAGAVQVAYRGLGQGLVSAGRSQPDTEEYVDDQFGV